MGKRGIAVRKHVRIVALVLVVAMMAFPSGALAEVKPTEGEITGYDVAFRTEPDLDSKIIGRLNKGDIVEIIDTNIDAEWHKVEFDGETGYVNRVFVDWDRSFFDVAESAIVYNVDQNVNVRAEPSADGLLLGVAPKGEELEIIDQDVAGGWHKVNYNGIEAYISSAYLQTATSVDDDELSALWVDGGSMTPKFTPEEAGYMVTTNESELTINVTANDDVDVYMNDVNTKSLTVEVESGVLETVRIKIDGSTRYTVYIMRDVITVGTWNIKRGDGNLLSQGKLVRDELPDIMGFQEVYTDYSGGEIVDNLLSLKTKHMDDTEFARAIDLGDGEYGNGTISHYDILSHEVFELPSAGYEQRVLSKSVLDIDGKRVSFYNTHLSYNSSSIREDQFAEIERIMNDDNNEYKILTGDFNADYDEITSLDGYNVVNTPDTDYYDYFGDPININEIDNIVLSDNIRLVNTRIVRTNISDHSPVFAYIVLE